MAVLVLWAVPKGFSWEIKRLKPRWELGVRRHCLLHVLLAQSSLRGHRGTSDPEEHGQANPASVWQLLG